MASTPTGVTLLPSRSFAPEQTTTRPDIRILFQQLLAPHRDSLSIDEFASLCGMLDIHLTTLQLQSIYTCLDPDLSGGIDFEEFERFLMPDPNVKTIESVFGQFAKLNQQPDSTIGEHKAVPPIQSMAGSQVSTEIKYESTTTHPKNNGLTLDMRNSEPISPPSRALNTGDSSAPHPLSLPRKRKKSSRKNKSNTPPPVLSCVDIQQEYSVVFFSRLWGLEISPGHGGKNAYVTFRFTDEERSKVVYGSKLMEANLESFEDKPFDDIIRVLNTTITPIRVRFRPPSKLDHDKDPCRPSFLEVAYRNRQDLDNEDEEHLLEPKYFTRLRAELLQRIENPIFTDDDIADQLFSDVDGERFLAVHHSVLGRTPSPPLQDEGEDGKPDKKSKAAEKGRTSGESNALVIDTGVMQPPLHFSNPSSSTFLSNLSPKLKDRSKGDKDNVISRMDSAGMAEKYSKKKIEFRDPKELQEIQQQTEPPGCWMACPAWIRTLFYVRVLEESELKEYGTHCKHCPKLVQQKRLYIHRLMEDESLNIVSYSIQIFVMLCILLSTAGYIFETLPDLADKKHIFMGIEWFVSIVFTIEYVTRICVCRNLCIYFWDTLNVVDFLAIVPFWIEILAGNAGTGALRVVRVVRLARVFRLMKSPRFIEYLRIIQRALSKSAASFGLLMTLICLEIIVASSLVYVTEGGKHGYTSIPATSWWAFVTVTTVGYGDMAPVSAPGRVVGVLAMFSGLLVIALPVIIIGGHFREEYEHYAALNRKETRMAKSQEGSLKTVARLLHYINKLLYKDIFGWEDVMILYENGFDTAMKLIKILGLHHGYVYLPDSFSSYKRYILFTSYGARLRTKQGRTRYATPIPSHGSQPHSRQHFLSNTQSSTGYAEMGMSKLLTDRSTIMSTPDAKAVTIHEIEDFELLALEKAQEIDIKRQYSYLSFHAGTQDARDEIFRPTPTPGPSSDVFRSLSIRVSKHLRADSAPLGPMLSNKSSKKSHIGDVSPMDDENPPIMNMRAKSADVMTVTEMRTRHNKPKAALVGDDSASLNMQPRVSPQSPPQQPPNNTNSLIPMQNFLTSVPSNSNALELGDPTTSNTTTPGASVELEKIQSDDATNDGQQPQQQQQKPIIVGDKSVTAPTGIDPNSFSVTESESTAQQRGLLNSVAGAPLLPEETPPVNDPKNE